MVEGIELDFGEGALHLGLLAAVGSYALGGTVREAAQAFLAGYTGMTVVGLIVAGVVLYVR